MIDLFRKQSSVANPPVKQAWIHIDCAVRAVERWLQKKREKQN